ncbi:MAG: hypothetical protein WA584_13950 [Pyrinomonadaceae bacterium]
MKKCPQCSRTYPDDTLAFCLEDGNLLSSSYNPQETNAPTVAINAGEVPTVAVKEIPTFVANEIPTVVNSSRPAERINNAGVGWKIYLAGFFISLVVDLVYNYLLFPLYAKATHELFVTISAKFDDRVTGFLVANTLLSTPTFVFVYSLLAFVLGFVWSRGKWKWGIIANIPNLAFTFYYVVISFADEDSSPTYYIRLFISTIIYIIAACLSARIGSRLADRISGK